MSEDTRYQYQCVARGCDGCLICTPVLQLEERDAKDEEIRLLKASLELANARLWYFRDAAKWLQRIWCIVGECYCQLCLSLDEDLKKYGPAPDAPQDVTVNTRGTHESN